MMPFTRKETFNDICWKLLGGVDQYEQVSDDKFTILHGQSADTIF